MSHSLHIDPNASKKQKYEELLPQLQALVEGEGDLIANMANISAALKQALGFFWVGFYLVKGDDLVLGPFQGSIACTRIKHGRGVCGTAWKEQKTMLVPNVEQFPGHIACDAASQSEIVIPLFRENEVIAVLDVDSDQLDSFNETDVTFLQQIVTLLSASYID